MSTPIILLVGQANSGKDTAAALLQEQHGAAIVSHSDPMKRFCRDLFGFSDEQLWGASEFRNAADSRLIENNGHIKNFEVVARDSFSRHLLHMFDDAPTAVSALKQWLVEMKSTTAQNRSTPRYILQTLGTEFGRKVEQDVWSNEALRVAKLLLKGGYAYDKTSGIVHTGHAGYPYVVITDGRFRNEIMNVKMLGGKVFKIENPQTVENLNHQSEQEQRKVPGNFYDGFIVNDKRNGLDSFKYVLTEVMETHFGVPEVFESARVITNNNDDNYAQG